MLEKVSAEGLVLDHVGIAVRSLEAARTFYEQLGMHVGEPETIGHEGVRVLMVTAGESRIELLEGLSAETVIGRFVTRRGQGMHHLALRVVNIDAVFAGMKARCVRLASDAIKLGARQQRYFFVHPESAGGVLTEMVESLTV